MRISVSSIINTFFIASVLIFLLLVAARFLSQYISSYTIAFCSVFIILRMLFPFEFFFTRAVLIKKVLPPIHVFLRTTVLPIGGSNFYLYQILMIGWIAVSSILVINSTVRYIAIRKKLLNCKKVCNSEIVEIYQAVNDSFSNQKEFDLVLSSTIHTPMVFGVRKPIIVLPEMDFTQKELLYIFQHELYHYYKKHLHIKILCELIRDIYFWNPFVYVMNYLINCALEYCTDAYITKTLNEYEKISYLECLVKIAKNQCTDERKNPYITAFSLSLKGRANKIMIKNKHKKYRMYNGIFLLCALVILIFPYFYSGEAYHIPKEIEEETFVMDESNSYYLKKEDNSYDLYFNGEFIANVTETWDPKIPIIENDEK